MQNCRLQDHSVSEHHHEQMSTHDVAGDDFDCNLGEFIFDQLDQQHATHQKVAEAQELVSPEVLQKV